MTLRTAVVCTLVLISVLVARADVGFETTNSREVGAATPTDDTAALQAALNAVAPGGTVIVEPRTYMINLAIGLRPKSNCRVSLRGATLRGTLAAGLGGRFFDLNAASNVTLSGGTLVGSRVAGPVWADGIIAANADGLTIEDMTFEDILTDGVLLTGSPGAARVRLRNCRFVNVRRVGLYVTSGRDIAVENCAFENTNGLAPEAGLQVQPGSGAVVEHVRITGSLFRNNRGTGISFQNAAGARLAQISITDNTIDGNLRGIAVAQASHLVLEGNRISGHSIKPNAGLTLGLGIFDATVTGNLLENNYRGIQADGASMVTLGANTIIGTGPRPALGLGAGADGDGITCGAAAGPAVSQCVVTGNVVSRSAGNGIRVLRSAYTIVADNVVTESGQQGISLQAVSDSQVRGNTVSRSSLESARSYDDIQIGAGSQRNVVAFNQCPYGGSPRSSIYVAATSIDTLVAENRLLGGAGLSNNSTTTSTNWDGSSADWNR